ncbi:MAG: DUF305 domain-containing protein [Alphaproteobacteria bacterium]|nr:DUF305 domain-containing protein [Alphaproteobacteria bacterium]
MALRWITAASLALAPTALAAADLTADRAPVLVAQAHQHQHGGPAAGVETASTKAYRQANDRMHKDMDIKFTGNADKDFAAGMIPHHQGAIDMAKIVLQHGKDAEVRKLAQEIIAAQEKEIAQLKAILARLR